MREIGLIFFCLSSVVGVVTLILISLCRPNKEDDYEGINVKLSYIIILAISTGISMIATYLLS